MMQQDIYYILPISYSGESYVWSTSQTQGFDVSRRSLDGTRFIVKYTAIYDVPLQLMGENFYSHQSIYDYIHGAEQFDLWNEPDPI